MLERKLVQDPRVAAVPDIHGHAKGEHKAFAEERPIPYTARMLFLWFFHACRRASPRFLMVADHMNYLTFEDPAAVNLVRRALKLAQAGDLYGAAETAGVELGHAAVVSDGLRKGMRYSIGAEIDNDPRCRPDAQNIVDAMKPDGMIRSVHFLPITHPQHGENWMWPFDNPEFQDLYDVVGPAKVWEIYIATLLETIDKLPGNIVGHFYVPAKFGHWPDDVLLEEYEDRFVSACAERGMAIEVNSRYFYKHYLDDDAQREKYRAVHLRLLRKAKERGVMIAVGSDAHSPKDQGGAFETVLGLLDEAEINEIAFPINGRLARVALRATEELLRQHSAALAPAAAQRPVHGPVSESPEPSPLERPAEMPAVAQEPAAAAAAARAARALRPRAVPDEPGVTPAAASGETPATLEPVPETVKKRSHKKTVGVTPPLAHAVAHAGEPVAGPAAGRNGEARPAPQPIASRTPQEQQKKPSAAQSRAAAKVGLPKPSLPEAAPKAPMSEATVSKAALPTAAVQKLAVPKAAVPKASVAKAAVVKAAVVKAAGSKPAVSPPALLKAAVSKAAVSRLAVSKATVAGAILPKAAASKATASKAIASKAAASKATAPRATASKSAVSKVTLSKAALSKASLSKAAASKAAASKTAASKAAPSKAALSKAGGSKAALRGKAVRTASSTAGRRKFPASKAYSGARPGTAERARGAKAPKKRAKPVSSVKKTAAKKSVAKSIATRKTTIKKTPARPPARPLKKASSKRAVTAKTAAKGSATKRVAAKKKGSRPRR